MKRRKRFVLPLLIAGMFLGSALSVSQARADNPIGYPFQVELRCAGGQSYDVRLLPGDALKLEGSTSNFRVAIWSYTDESGVVHYLVNSKSDPREALLTCHYTGPLSGIDYTVVGFFTPVGP